jgi:hypothetical protein
VFHSGRGFDASKIRTRNTTLNESLQYRRYTGRPPEKRLEVKKKF